MASRQTNNNDRQTIDMRSAVSYPSDLRRGLGISAKEINAELNERGEHPPAVVATMDAMVEALRVKLVPRRIEGPETSEILDGLESLRFYEESVTAGVPCGNGDDVPYRKARPGKRFLRPPGLGVDIFGERVGLVDVEASHHRLRRGLG